MTQADKSGGPPRAHAPMAAFRRTMANCGFIDMVFVGSRYTWSNKFTKERLDKGFQTPLWRNWFPHNRVITLDPSESDHSPLLIEIQAGKQRKHRSRRLFRFEEIWHENSECNEIIKQGWAHPLTGNAL
ncbi:uncharacterized protein LOC133732417 [Rosa rugosa]|uniref:uncharacterized protein LOC133732417 n=1 Tax=Rosa rugosa TaxID=74645 RepID=UPI002B412AFC|nr:uncharacterized protein LOC133732417 [Rosa rugosa]